MKIILSQSCNIIFFNTSSSLIPFESLQNTQ